MTIQPLRSAGTRGRLLALSLLTPICQLHAANGTWTADAPGNWSDTTKWKDGIVASGAGFTADFSTLDITGDHLVTIDSPVTIGTLSTQDLPNISNSWTFGGPGTLTLDNGATQPVLNILNRAPTISASLAGINGFSKTGLGTVNLSGNNAGLSGVMNLPNVGGTNGAGVVLLNDTALGAINTINIGGTSNSGQFLGLNGGVTLGSGVTINLNSPGGNNAPAGGIRSDGGNTVVNTINGPLNVTQTGSRISNNSAKRLDINGAITGGGNNVVFRFGANEGIHLTNTNNSWTGTTTHSGGTLWFEPGTLPDAPLQITASDAGSLQTHGTFTRSLGLNTGEVYFTLSAERKSGFGARGGPLTVNLGGAGAEVFFDTAATASAAAIRTNQFVLNGGTADSKITLANPINLNGAGRTLHVDANVAEITGGLKGGSFPYTKMGAGTLLLSNANNTWTGDLTIASDGNSVDGGVVRLTHSEALGAPATVKNVNAMGLNRGISLVELDGGIAIDANKTLKMWGKNMAMPGAAGSGLPQALRNASGNNAWNGNILISAVGGSYGVESAAGTLTLGADTSTTSVIRNDVGASTRYFSLFGAGNIVVNSKIADNDDKNIILNKVSTGTLVINRNDNNFDTAPNLFAGTTEVRSIGGIGIAGALGVASSFNLGATLRYTGAGEYSDKTLNLLPTGGTLDASGSGPLELYSSAFVHHAGITATTVAPFALGATSLVINDAAGIAVGQTITGTSIAANTTVTAVEALTRTITLSQPTTAESTVGVTVTIGGAETISRTLNLTGTSTADNRLAAPLNNPSANATLGVTKTGAGKWVLGAVGGAPLTYSGPTMINQGTLGFDGSFPVNSALTVDPSATLSLANVTLRANEQTGLALAIDGALSIDGPVSIILPDSIPTGSYPILQYASITGTENLTSNYRGAVFTPTAGTLSMKVGAGAALTWAGTLESSTWDTKVSANWSGGQRFFWSDAVRFDDTGATAPNVDMSGELRPGSITVDADFTEYSLQGSGFLSGDFKLTKNGEAMLRLGGANTFRGEVEINEGSVQLEGQQALGAIGNQISVAEGAKLDAWGQLNTNRDYHITIAGEGTDGTGALVDTSFSTNVSGFGSLTLNDDATIGGTGRFDIRPITAGAGLVDLAGHTLTKSGTNLVGLINGTIADGGTINVTEGTLAFTRMTAGNVGNVNVASGATMRFENYTSGSFSRTINLDGGRLHHMGDNFAADSNVVLASGNIDVDGTRTLTIQGVVSGEELLKSGAGALALTKANTYTGTTTINSGELVIGSQTSAGTLGTGPVMNYGTLRINRGDRDYVVSNVISGSGVLSIGQNGNTPITNSLVTVTGNNDFTGNVNVSSGGLKIFNASALGVGPKNIGLNNGSVGRSQLYLDGSGGNITLPAEFQLATSNDNLAEPAIGNLKGNNVIAGPITMTAGSGSTAISVFEGTLALNGDITGNTTSRRLLLAGTAGSGTVNGVISNAGVNPVGVTKSGPLVWTLTGSNTYTGTTVVSEGTLRINSNQGAASGAVSVASGATLDGNGTIGGAITADLGSTISPGDSIGTLTTTAPATISGTLKIEVNATTSDRLAVGGSLTLSGATLDVSALGALTQPAYVIASYGLLNGTFSSITGLPSGYLVNYNYNGLGQIALVEGTDAYAAFELANGISGAGSAADSDNDGIPNGVEFVLGGKAAGPNSESSALLPTVTADATYLNFVFRRTQESAPYNPYVQYGNDLDGWTQAQNNVGGVIIEVSGGFYNATTDRVTVRIPRSLAGPGAKLFARLQANVP